jgi:hypothetical protein
MGIHIGSSEKLKISASKSGIFRLNIPSLAPVVNGVMLRTTDNYILKDSNGMYITAKEDR